MFEHFIKKEQKNYNVLFINVWKSDFYKEPVIAILSELVNEMKKSGKQKNKEQIIKTIGKIGMSVSSQLIQSKTGINLKEITNSIKIGKDLLKGFEQRKEAIEEIETAILKYTENKQLLIIVDELDRTRPDYAVRFLEDMKHFFDIKKTVFLIAVNKKQMEATVIPIRFKFSGFDKMKVVSNKCG